MVSCKISADFVWNQRFSVVIVCCTASVFQWEVGALCTMSISNFRIGFRLRSVVNCRFHADFILEFLRWWENLVAFIFEALAEIWAEFYLNSFPVLGWTELFEPISVKAAVRRRPIREVRGRHKCCHQNVWRQQVSNRRRRWSGKIKND